MEHSSRPTTGYPYPNPAQSNGYPPPQPGAAAAYPYQNPYYAPPQPNPRATFYRRLLIIFFASFVVAGVIIFIFFLVLRPRFPNVTIASISVTNFNVTGNQVSGNWYTQFQIRNPNHKMSFNYYDIYCSVYYHKELLADTRLPPFEQATRALTPINATLSVTGTYVEGGLVDSIRKDRAARGSVQFDLKVNSIVVYRYGVIMRRRYITFFCNDVEIDLPANSSSGQMKGPAKKCKIY